MRKEIAITALLITVIGLFLINVRQAHVITMQKEIIREMWRSRYRTAHEKVEGPKNLNLWYAGHNSEYFGDKLPHDTVVDWSERNDMGTTSVLGDGRFHIALNPRYASGTRTSHLVMLHEECHIRAWDEYSRNRALEHGPRWRTCMLTLDMQGAFRRELIDGYKDDK